MILFEDIAFFCGYYSLRRENFCKLDGFSFLFLRSSAVEDKNLSQARCHSWSVGILNQARIFMFCTQRKKIYHKDVDTMPLFHNIKNHHFKNSREYYSHHTPKHEVPSRFGEGIFTQAKYISHISCGFLRVPHSIRMPIFLWNTNNNADSKCGLLAWNFSSIVAAKSAFSPSYSRSIRFK